MRTEIIDLVKKDTPDWSYPELISKDGKENSLENDLSEILFITSYPPDECGIATYSQDLIKALQDKFSSSFTIKVCALKVPHVEDAFPDEVKCILDAGDTDSYSNLISVINQNDRLKLVLIQHEFGLFQDIDEQFFLQFLNKLTKPIVIVFHTVLPHPDESLKTKIKNIALACESVIVMTNHAAQLLIKMYDVPLRKITVIPHGTHLVKFLDKDILKKKYKLTGKKVLSTFGLINPGKSIETTLDALPEIIVDNPEVLFLIIGKTHPGILKQEQEKYRNMLVEKIELLKLHQHVKFINSYLSLPDLLEYLQLTDIYLFTSKDPHQAVSGTFSYAMSCACPIISTPIPHAKEALGDNTGIIIDFQNSKQLAAAVKRLLGNDELRATMSSNALHQMAATAWENSAIAHAMLFQKITNSAIHLKYNIPKINLDHFKRLTTDFGMLQFSKVNQPDPESGYTLDDNARALIAISRHYELTNEKDDLNYINIYLHFIKYCLQPKGYFLNYVNKDKKFTAQNDTSNLADANGRAIWALGFLISKSDLLPQKLISVAKDTLERALTNVDAICCTRAIAFTIKGLYYYNSKVKSDRNRSIIEKLANRLEKMYKHENEKNWEWYESYLTYGNSVLPEAMLYAFQLTGDKAYERIARTSFDFLLTTTFNNDKIKLISNKSWLHKGSLPNDYGEQPIDVAYTILALNQFYDVFKDKRYLHKMEIAFSWFLGNNHLHQIIYNPCTGGCYDGLEEIHVNLNQGAESTVSYLLARLTIEEKFKAEKSDKRRALLQNIDNQFVENFNNN